MKLNIDYHLIQQLHLWYIHKSSKSGVSNGYGYTHVPSSIHDSVRWKPPKHLSTDDG